MKTLYDVFIALVKACLPIAGVFSDKLKTGAQGREQSWDVLDQNIKHTVPKIWVHVASLGEYEQIVPVLESLNHEEFQVVLSFFSPSGFENKKHTKLADVVTYLPIDTSDNASKFLDMVEPDLAIFVKYEFWPNYLNQLKKRNIKTILVSGVFRNDMVFSKWYGKWMVESLNAFDHFFLQNQSSLEALKKIGFSNATVSGDTRFDRAAQLIEQEASDPIMDSFVAGMPCLVIGSSWPEDIAVLKEWINNHSGMVKVMIAPHEVLETHVQKLSKEISNVRRWTKSGPNDEFAANDVLVIDTIGKLTTAYSYAKVAYVGGGMGTKGLHNILEAATYGIPVIIGKNYEKFPEAGKLEDLGGLFSVQNSSEFNQIADKLFEDNDFCEKTGMISGHWINSNTGATRAVLNYLREINENYISN